MKGFFVFRLVLLLLSVSSFPLVLASSLSPSFPLFPAELPPTTATVDAADALFRPAMTAEEFYSKHYRKHTQHLSPPSPSDAFFAFDSEQQMLSAVGETFGAFQSVAKGIRVHRDGVRLNASDWGHLPWPRIETALLKDNISLVLQAEYLRATEDPLNMSQRALEPLVALLGANLAEASTHYYLSGKNAKALKPHDDRYDVVILHMAGEKTWTTCAPRASEKLPASLNDAERALLRVLQSRKGRVWCWQGWFDDAYRNF